jgi:acyl phosphate:glycerol-3-phosphate acyltransferase
MFSIPFAIAIALAYLLGSVPFAVLVSRAFGLADPRSYGSKNPGATNVLRSGNKPAAALTLIGDSAKGWLAVFLAQRFAVEYGFGPGMIATIGLAVFLGHLYPVFLKFKGGKGVATAAGVLLALNVWLGLAVLGTWIAVVLIFRYSSLGALVAAAAAPLYAALGSSVDSTVIVIGLISMALIGKHWGNLQRLLSGREPRIGGKKAA